MNTNTSGISSTSNGKGPGEPGYDYIGTDKPTLRKATVACVRQRRTVDPETGEIVEQPEPAPRGSSGRDRKPELLAKSKRGFCEYAQSNELSHRWMLTYADPPESEQRVKDDLQAFTDRLRDECFGGRDFPYLDVVEIGEQNGRPHAHAWTPMLPRSVVERVWGHGIVKQPAVARSAKARWKSAEYGTKDFKLDAGGKRRYGVAQGFPVPKVSRRFRTHREAVAWVFSRYDGPPTRTWCDADIDGWQGPPCWGFVWDEVARGSPVGVAA